MSARIAIVGGGGGVGSSLAFNLLLRPEPYDVALVDGQSGMARSHEMDLQQVLAWTSGFGIARMVAALLGPPVPEPWPASVVLAGEYGIEDVALTVPVTLGHGGATQVHEWELTPAQAAAMRAAADGVRSAAVSL